MNEGTSAFVEHGIVQKAIAEIRKNFGDRDCNNGRCMSLSIHHIRTLWINS